MHHSQILTVLLDYFKGDILTVGPFLFRFFQISFACGISVLEHEFRQVVLSLSGCEIPPSSFSSLSGLGILAFLGFFSIWFLSLRTLQSEMLKDRLHL
ncbi:unnamed protein product [Rhizophagus irregularis]|uniref:Uncharacterized protein n=1 Tax=Rhizophagus irregularis TaxID=588596 RepID=A0A915Z4W1_9GLOM|nr:unnamed protein product [Rhizophagus irregularis]